MIECKNRLLPVDDFLIIPYKDHYVICDIASSRVVSLEAALFNKLSEKKTFDDEYMTFFKELDMLKDTVFTDTNKLKPGLRQEELLIHEVQLGAFTKCNLSCKYCFRHKGKQDDHDITLDEAKQLIDGIVNKFVLSDEDNTWLMTNLGLSGEVLTDLPFFEQLREHAREVSAQTGRNIMTLFYNSNGTLLSEEATLKLRHLSEMTEITVSVDGPVEIHDTMRVFANGTGSYEAVEKNVTACNEIMRTTGEAVLTGKMPFVTDIFLDLYRLGFRSICIKPVRAHPTEPYAINPDNITAVKEEYDRFVKFLTAQDDERLLKYLFAMSERDFFGKIFHRLLQGRTFNRRCNALFRMIGVDRKGDIYPCVSTLGIDEFKLGNIFDADDAWQEKRSALIERFVINKAPGCNKCPARSICGGECLHDIYIHNGEPNVADKVMCRLIRHVMQLSMILLHEIGLRPDVHKALISRYNGRYIQALPPRVECIPVEESPLTAPHLWEKAHTIDLNREQQFRGFTIHNKQRFTGSVRILYDADNFYLKFVIHEDEQTRRARDVFTDENIIRFSITDVPAQPCFEYSVAIQGGKPGLLKHTMYAMEKHCIDRIDEATVLVEQDEATTGYYIALPWESFDMKPVRDKQFKFNGVIYERYRPYIFKSWYEWSPGLAVELNPATFGNLFFK